MLNLGRRSYLRRCTAKKFLWASDSAASRPSKTLRRCINLHSMVAQRTLRCSCTPSCPSRTCSTRVIQLLINWRTVRDHAKSTNSKQCLRDIVNFMAYSVILYNNTVMYPAFNHLVRILHSIFFPRFYNYNRRVIAVNNDKYHVTVLIVLRFRKCGNNNRMTRLVLNFPHCRLSIPRKRRCLQFFIRFCEEIWMNFSNRFVNRKIMDFIGARVGCQAWRLKTPLKVRGSTAVESGATRWLKTSPAPPSNFILS